jgi:hypothetical protein
MIYKESRNSYHKDSDNVLIKKHETKSTVISESFFPPNANKFTNAEVLSNFQLFVS